MVRYALAAIATCFAVQTGVAAQEIEEAPAAPAAPASADAMIGPVVGSQSPALDMVEAIGTEASMAPGDNGTVVVFVRSADWCPYCKVQLVELNAAAAPLRADGWQLSALSYDSPAVLEAFATENALDFALLSDQGSAAIRAFNLLNEEMKPASRAFGIPHPAVVFIRNDGTIGAVLREEGFKTRPSVESILETATLLNEAAAGL